MFTGIVQAVGKILATEKKDGDACLRVETDKLDMTNVTIGDSIAVSGVCLTLVEFTAAAFSADISKETLSRTTLGRLRPGDAVNLEKALTLSTPLGGHLVSGHVDGVGNLTSIKKDGRSVQLWFEAPTGLARYIAEKGSICVDGVSLTVNEVNGARFGVNLVPHTLAETTLRNLSEGATVNLEVDMLARYLERLMLGGNAGRSGSSITREFLARNGFIKSSD
ncbi:MAG TPA: riboflavin synthase [Sulfuricaulis sp.]|nr:riboflavin synthase [Sulfuricaulis sp.]